jgi:two-component system, cell cycle sensor histidine kinase and response regulator CckA
VSDGLLVGAGRAGEPGPAAAGADALRILILEDDLADAELEQWLLRGAGVDFTAVVVDAKASYLRQLDALRPDVILSDFGLPGFSGESALRIARERCPQVPFIFLSGVLGDDAAVELIRQGATDYVLKDRMGRLPSVVRRAVTEARQRQRLAGLEAQLQRSQRLDSFCRLAAGVAHEFNNQVGVMLNYAAFIREQAAGQARPGPHDEGWDEVARDAGQIEQAGQRVLRLVHQLLAAGGQQPICPSLIDLNQVIRGIDELLRFTAGAGVQVRARLAPRLWLVTADRAEVEQVLLNLTMNARDAMPAGGRFSIETSNAMISTGEAADRGLAPGAYVRLTGRDNGAGMDQDTLEHAFEPFFTTKPFVEGGGLGLSAVYGIIRQAGGTVELSSAPGTGTTVTLWLPAATSDTAAATGRPAAAAAAARITASPGTG